MNYDKERINALEKHMEFLLKIPVDKLETHSNECLQYRGLADLELEESYQARKLSFNLLHTETGPEDFLKKFYQIEVNCNMVDKDKFLANDTLFKRKDNCVYAGKIIFIPITSKYQFDKNTIRNYYYYNYDKIVDSVTKRSEFMEWLDEKLKDSCKIEIKNNPEKVNAYVEKHFKEKDKYDNGNNTNTPNNNNSDLPNHCSDIIKPYRKAPTVCGDDTTQTEQKLTSSPTMVKELPDTNYLFTNKPKQETKLSVCDISLPSTKDLESINKETHETIEENSKTDSTTIAESKNKLEEIPVEKWKLESKKFKEDCIDTIYEIVRAYENNVFNDKTNIELKEIAMNFIKHTKELAMEGDDWVQKKNNPKIEQALKDITNDYRKLVCCRERDSRGCVVCPSPNHDDVRKNPLNYIKRSLKFLIER